MKSGIIFVAFAPAAAAICGLGPILGYWLALGLVPPADGCAWQPPQLLELKPGPNPAPGSPAIVPVTESTCRNRDRPSWKNWTCAALNEDSGCPAATDPVRTPG